MKQRTHFWMFQNQHCDNIWRCNICNKAIFVTFCDSNMYDTIQSNMWYNVWFHKNQFLVLQMVSKLVSELVSHLVSPMYLDLNTSLFSRINSDFSKITQNSTFFLQKIKRNWHNSRVWKKQILIRQPIRGLLLIWINLTLKNWKTST